MVGYTLGGGLGWLARKHGLATNSVTAIEIVTADGDHVRVDHDYEPDLFWALRGGGGSFGVVTAMEFELYPLREVYGGWLIYPFERASEVMHAWREWAPTVPDEVTSIARLLQLPPLPDIPEPLRGGSFAVIEAAYIGDESDGANLIRPLRELGPAIDTFTTMPARALTRLHQDPEEPVPGIGDGMVLAETTADAIDALVEVSGPGSGSPLLSVELRQLGGALARRDPAAGALATIEGDSAMFAVGLPMTPDLGELIHARVEAIKQALAPWNSSHAYFNFAEVPADADGLFAAETYRRLCEVKARYDADEMIVSNHPIKPAR